MMRALVVMLMGCGGAAPAVVANRVPGAPAAAPDLAGLRSLLAALPDGPFDKQAQARGCPSDQTLHAYVDLLVKEGSPAADGDTHRLAGGCGEFPRVRLPIDPPADAAYWFCTIDSATSDPAGESPWHYALHVRVRRADRRVDLTTVACPGA